MEVFLAGTVKRDEDVPVAWKLIGHTAYPILHVKGTPLILRLLLGLPLSLPLLVEKGLGVVEVTQWWCSSCC